MDHTYHIHRNSSDIVEKTILPISYVLSKNRKQVQDSYPPPYLKNIASKYNKWKEDSINSINSINSNEKDDNNEYDQIPTPEKQFFEQSITPSKTPSPIPKPLIKKSSPTKHFYCASAICSLEKTIPHHDKQFLKKHEYRMEDLRKTCLQQQELEQRKKLKKTHALAKDSRANSIQKQQQILDLGIKSHQLWAIIRSKPPTFSAPQFFHEIPELTPKEKTEAINDIDFYDQNNHNKNLIKLIKNDEQNLSDSSNNILSKTSGNYIQEYLEDDVSMKNEVDLYSLTDFHEENNPSSLHEAFI